MPDLATQLSTAFSGRYRIERLLGEGGMAIVYLAEDLKHARKVALKVLRPELAAMLGGDRFVAEIKTTASLQHPHILPLFDSGQVEAGQRSFLYYVMPYIEGETLRQKLDREKQLGVEETVRIARAVATALDYAHRRGIVHRDIKPENVMLFEGQALVADFGIALAISQAGGMRVTETGLSIGTPHYMSPEQASADRALDARTDIYSLGAVTFEMLVGRRPFDAANTPAVMSKILTEGVPPIRKERASVPRNLDAAVQVAMAKLPADRFATAAEFAAALVDPGFTLQTDAVVEPRAGLPIWRRLLWPALLVAALVVAWLGWQRAPAPSPIARLQLDFPEGYQLAIAGARSSPFDISPDGSRLAFLADSGSGAELYVRDLKSPETRALEGTRGALQPFFSPDGNWIGFFRDNAVLRVAVAGGAPIVISATKGATYGGSWGPGNRLLFATDSGLFLLESLDAAPVAIPLESPGLVRWPHFLPDGRSALVATDSGTVLVQLGSHTATRLLAGAEARYVPTGHLVFLTEDRRVRAVPFDLRNKRITGTEFPILDNVFRGPGSGAGYFAVASGAGTLVYVQASFNRGLVLVDRNGRETPVPAELRGYRFPAVSPDGHYAAVTVDPRPSDLWIVDLIQGTAERQQTPGHDGWGVWSPEGKRVAFLWGFATGPRSPSLGWRSFPFTSEPVPIEYRGTRAVYPKQWVTGDRLLGSSAGGDVVAVSVRDGSLQSVVATPSVEQEPALSPDGRWLSYQSDASGSTEIYVQSFTTAGQRQAVSKGGGFDPAWAPDGAALYYRRGNSIMAVPVRTGQQFQVIGPPEVLFTRAYDFTQTGNWTVTPSGRFLMIKGDPTTTTRFQVVLNWFAELRGK